MPKVKRLG